MTIGDSGHPARDHVPGGHGGRPELRPSGRPGDGNAQLVQGGAKVGGGALKMGVTDGRAVVGAGDAGSPVAAGTAQRLAQDRHDVRPVSGIDATGEERAG